MDRALLEQHLVLAERHIAGGEQCVARQREIIVRLERVGLGASETAIFARGLLRDMEATLSGARVERKRLQAQLRG